MAQRTETLLLGVKIDQGAAKQQAAELTVTLQKQRQELANLEKQYRDGLLSEKQYGDEAVRLKAAIGENTKQLRLSETAAKANNNSIAAQRAELAKLKDALINTTNPTKEQIKQVRELSDTLKENEAAIGDNTRNVGNYIRDINIMGVNVGQAADSFKNGSEGIKVFTKGLMTSRGAAIALTAVPIIALFVGLLALIKSTDEGADKFKQVIDGLTTAFTVLTKGVAPLGRILIDIFTSSFDALIGFKDAVVGLATLDFDQLQKGTDEVNGAFNKVKQSIKDNQINLVELAGAAYEAAFAQAELTKATQDLEDAEAALNLQRAQANAAVRLALISAKDQSKAVRDRLALLDEAGKKEKDVSDQELQNARTRVLIAQNQAFVQSGLVEMQSASIEGNAALLEQLNEEGKVTDDLLNAARDAQAQMVTIDADSAENLQKIQNRRAAFLADERERYEKEQELLLAFRDFKARLRAAEEIDNDKEIADALEKATERAEEDLSKYQINIGKRMAADQKAVDETLAQAKREADEKERLRQVDLARQEQFFQASEQITQGLSSLNTILNGEAAASSEFQKQIALFQLAIQTAKAIASAVANADLPYPANLVAIATSVATVLANIAQAKSLLSEANPPQAPTGAFAGGGDFLTMGPQYIKVGDNPGGVERVTVEPISGRGQTRIGQGAKMLHLAGGGSVTAFNSGSLAGQSIVNQVNNQVAAGAQIGSLIDNVKIVQVVETYERVKGQMTRVVENSTV